MVKVISLEIGIYCLPSAFLTKISQWLSPLNSSVSRIVFWLFMADLFRIMFTLYEVLCANAKVPMYPIIFAVLSERPLLAQNRLLHKV